MGYIKNKVLANTLLIPSGVTRLEWLLANLNGSSSSSGSVSSVNNFLPDENGNITLPIDTPTDGVVSGGVVTWLQDYDFEVSAATYYINGVLYESPVTQLTLPPSDVTNDRIDLFVLDTTGSAVVLEGTPSATPEEPNVNIDTQIRISFVLVLANSTEPNVVEEQVYIDNTEWTTASNSGNINPDSSNNPDGGTKCIEGTNVATGNSLTLTNPGPDVDFSEVDIITFRIRSKAGWSSRKLQIQFMSGNTLLGNQVLFGSAVYGFTSTNTTTYQTISIPLSDFGNIGGANKIRFRRSGTGTIGFYIDNIRLLSSEIISDTNTYTIANPPITADTKTKISYDSKGLVLAGMDATTDDIAEGSVNEYFTDLKARSAISLTTTGSSGAATYNSSTGVLNVPQYSGGGSDYLHWFDVVGTYGADNTGATDATAAIQSAINAAVAAGGGTVYFQIGTYKISGSVLTTDGTNTINSAQLYLPYSTWGSANKVHIRLLGEVAPVQYTSRRQTIPTTKGVVLKSDVLATGAILGTAWNTDGENPGFNFNQLTIENIQFTVRSKTAGVDVEPLMGGVNADHMAYIGVEHCVINSESAMASTVQPTANIGFKAPANANWARIYLEDVAVYNFFTGVQASEHFSSIQLYVATCVNGIELIASTHSINFVRPLIQWCINNIKISGACYFKFDNLDLEAYSTISGNPSKWYLPSLDVYEPSTTNSVGLIHFQKTISNVGVDNSTFSVSGTLSPGIKYRILNDFYSTLGINTNTPLAKLHIVNGAVPSFPTIQANDLDIGEAANDYFRSFVVGTNRVAGFRFYKSGASTSQGSIKYDMSTDEMQFYTNQVTTPRLILTSTGIANIPGSMNVGSGKLFVDSANSWTGINTLSPIRPLTVIGAGTPTAPVNLGTADFIYVAGTGNTAIAINSGTTSIGGIKFYENGQSGQQKGSIYYDHNTDQFRFTTNQVDVTSTSNLVLTSNGDLGINTGLTANSKLQVGGAIALPYRPATSGWVLDATDNFIDYTGTGTHTFTLPTAVGITGRLYTVKNGGTGNVTFTTTSSQTIDGVTSITLTPGESYSVRSNGTNWSVQHKTGNLQSRVSTQFDATSTTTLANITGLTSPVIAGKTYRFEAKLYTTSNVAGGVKVAIAGTATATAIIYEGLTTDAGVITQSRGTALATAVGAVTAVTAAYIEINGTITVNAAGTLTVQFAQNASNGTASSVLVGSTFVVTEII